MESLASLFALASLIFLAGIIVPFGKWFDRLKPYTRKHYALGWLICFVGFTIASPGPSPEVTAAREAREAKAADAAMAEAEEAEAKDAEERAAARAAKAAEEHNRILAKAEEAIAYPADYTRSEYSDNRWEDIKAAERTAAGQASTMDGVATALPALLRSHKLQKRAARVGFEWPDVDGPIAKLHEELAELDSAETLEDRILEAGDVLFAAVNIIRRYGVEPEQALRASNAKFERRFRKMEELSDKDGETFGDLDLDTQERYWQRAKRELG